MDSDLLTAISQPAPSPAEFKFFPSLPAELRIQIWKESFEPRVVEMHLQKVVYIRGTRSMWMSNCSNPAALSVCAEARALAKEHFSVLLPVFKPNTDVPSPRHLYFSPESDLLAILGDVDFMRLSDIFQTVRRRDPTGYGLRRFGLSMSCWAYDIQFANLKVLNRVLFGELDDIVLLMYNEQRPPASFRDGECVLEPVKGMASFSRVLSTHLRQVYRGGQFRLMNLTFIPGPVSRRSSSSSFGSSIC
ncbi:hypothetical protein F5Y04DRAFT_168813 [Hypomontagnella monticulosa]|nr:hypothetical protein F5Y04DRAFT_168813 [Hypomontagnella monticulosa]